MSGPGPVLPRRADDPGTRTPSALLRREAFARRHPEVSISTRREGTRLVFEVSEPGQAAKAYDDADVMLDELEARYP